MTHLILIRHGQSTTNLQRAFTGQSDAQLTPLGLSQAEETARAVFRSFPVSRLYASDLSRTMSTAAPLSRFFQLPVQPDARLREICIPSWQGLAFSEIEGRYPDEIRLWRTDIGHFRGPDGESILELATRVEACLREICEANPGQTVAVVTHATPIRAMRTLWTAGDLSLMKDVPWSQNAGVFTADYDCGVFRVTELQPSSFAARPAEAGETVPE